MIRKWFLQFIGISGFSWRSLLYFTLIIFSIQCMLGALAMGLYSIKPKPDFPNHQMAQYIVVFIVFVFWLPSWIVDSFLSTDFYHYMDDHAILNAALMVTAVFVNSMFLYWIWMKLKYLKNNLKRTFSVKS